MNCIKHKFICLIFLSLSLMVCELSRKGNCAVVDCGRPPAIPNGRGRGYLLNGTTSFGSIVEYHCLPDFQMFGDFQQRKCLATGDWSGTIPRCLKLTIANEIESTIKSQSDEDTFDPNFAASKAIGIGIAVGAGALLIIIIIVGIIYLKALLLNGC